MTTKMEVALAEVAKLPPEEQDAFAAWILAELKVEQRWSKLLDRSSDLLAALADEALAEDRARKTLPLDPEAL